MQAKEDMETSQGSICQLTKHSTCLGLTALFADVVFHFMRGAQSDVKLRYAICDVRGARCEMRGARCEVRPC